MMEATRPRTDESCARPITSLVGDGVLDAELAALVWLLVEGHVPIVVAAREPLAARIATLAALLDFLPQHVRRVSLQGHGETFDWLAGAAALGWLSPADALDAMVPGATAPGIARPGVSTVPEIDRDGMRDHGRPVTGDPELTYLVAAELGPGSPAGTWGTAARVVVRALQRGYGLGTTMHADSLEEVLGTLADAPVSLGADELRRLGTVLVFRGGRVVAAHYLRPLERDGAGHLQRRPPAVLATLNASRGTYEHFAWGLTPELALRVGRSQADFEREQDARAGYLSGLAARGGMDGGGIRAALAAYRGQPHAAPREVPSG